MRDLIIKKGVSELSVCQITHRRTSACEVGIREVRTREVGRREVSFWLNVVLSERTVI